VSFVTVRVFKTSLVVLLLLAISVAASGQANVNEGLETAFIYVDGSAGSDSNPGTQSQPLKTIGAAVSMAVSNNHKSIGSRVVINPGTYRESVSVGNGSQSTSLPMTFQAATDGTVIVSGADVWTGWTPYSGNGKIFTQSWPYQWGLCPGDPGAPTEQDIILRQEMVVVNGTPLTEVLTLTAMRPGTFFPDEANSTLYVWPPAGTNMATATVEVSTRPSLFVDAGQPNVVVRGLTFQYANSCHQSAAVSVMNGATNVLLDTDNYLWNNAVGLTLNGAVEYFTVQNNVASHNGQAGFNTSQVKAGLWQSDTTSYNNWRGAQGAFYSWDTGGTKFLLDHDSTFNQLTTIYNQSHGAAFDTDNQNESLDSLVSVGNVGTGFYAEKSEGPLYFTNSYFCGNNLQSNQYLGGITFRDSASVWLVSSTLFGNGGTQIDVIGQPGGFAIPNWETGQIYDVNNQNFTFTKNKVSGPASVQLFSDGYLDGSDWNQFSSTLRSGSNTWWAGTNTNAFTLPAPKTWTDVDMTGWRSATGQDQRSTWESVPTPAACNIATKGPDYWLLMMTSTSRPISVSPAGVAQWNLATLPMGGMTGTVSLTVDSLSGIPGAASSFSPASISTSGASVMTLTTSASTPAGTYPVTIIANNGNVTHAVTVSVVVPQTSVRLSTTSLTFSSQKVKTSSDPQNITVTNTGKAPLALSPISLSGSFSQTNTCGVSIKAGGSCTISVTFTPKVVGTISQRMSLRDGDPTSPQSITLTGTGLPTPSGRVSPSNVGFGLQKIGTHITKTITLSNQGTAALTISSMKLTGTDHADFSQKNTCGGSVPVGGSCEVNITFDPSAKGTQVATLYIYDNDLDSPQTVDLKGGGH
jgi:Abnormal spindle-like microcephaly-assoc'd, ASPM-SPD-2-Hydin